MLVTLFHNAFSGSENHTAADLSACVKRAGHHVVAMTSSLRELQVLLQSKPVDLLVVAGGDGTLSLVTCHVESLPCPLTILPLGTANDVALSLGVAGPTEALIAGWNHGRLVPFDLGALQFRNGNGARVHRFAEAVGWGAFADLVSASALLPKTEDRQTRLRTDRLRFWQQLRRASPRHYHISADGRDFSGRYLMVEVLNVPFIGPRVCLSSKSNPSDGQFELVLVGERERSTLMTNLDDTCPTAELVLPCYSARRIDVQSSTGHAHLDGETLQRIAEPPNEFSIGLDARSARLLVPEFSSTKASLESVP
ncbi:MAG: diacylglycerol kinase family protein [Polyangiaceae bacterium]